MLKEGALKPRRPNIGDGRIVEGAEHRHDIMKIRASAKDPPAASFAPILNLSYDVIASVAAAPVVMIPTMVPALMNKREANTHGLPDSSDNRPPI